MTAHITVYMLMNTTDFEAGALKTKAIGDELSNTMGTTGTSMGLKLSKGFEDGTKGIGGLFTKIGNMGSSMGIPLSGAFTKIGVSIQGADTKAATFAATMEGIGKISLFAGLAAGAAVALEGVKVWEASLINSLLLLRRQPSCSLKLMLLMHCRILQWQQVAQLKPCLC